MNIIYLTASLLLTILSVQAQWSAPVQLGGPINSDPTPKTWPSIDASGDTLYYAKIGSNGNENICYSYKLNDGTWSAPLFLPSSINTPYIEISPSIGPGDSILYFVSSGLGGYGSFDIWYTRRDANGQWMEPENPGPNINTSGLEWGVFISRDGQSLYFSSTRGPVGGLDIMKSTWQGTGWGPAEALPGLNWWGDEENVTLPADESSLILTMPRWVMTGVDLWSSTFDGEVWSPPAQIVDLISASDEDGASLSPDGNTLFFSSKRNDPQAYHADLFISQREANALPLDLPYSHSEKSLIYPNPYHGGDLVLQLATHQAMNQTRISLYDILGRTLVADSPVELQQTNLSTLIERLPNGKYWLNIKSPAKMETIPVVIIK